MLAEQLYDPGDRELTALRLKARKMARRYNQTDEDEPEKQQLVGIPVGKESWRLIFQRQSSQL